MLLMCSVLIQSVFAEFATSKLTSSHVQVTSSSFDRFMSSSPLPKVLLFSSKKVTSPLYKALSNRFKGKLVLGEARDTEKDLVAKYKVASFPTLLVFENADSEPVQFTEAFGGDALMKFLTPFAQNAKPAESTTQSQKSTESEPKKAEEPKTEPKKATPPPPKIDATVVQFTSDSVAEKCTGASMCILVFVDGQDKLEQHKDDVAALATKYAGDRFKFGWVDVNTESALAGKFGVTGGDNVVAFNPRRKRASNYSGELDVKAVGAFLDRVVSGDAKFQAVDCC